MKRLVRLGVICILTGCTQTTQPEKVSVISLGSNEVVAESTVLTESRSTTLREDGVRSATTDYSTYAVPDTKGYAYYIHDDPDVSSEIKPLTENSSSDVVLLTFDDCPRLPESHIMRIAETLKAKNANAIFLANGMYLQTDEGKQLLKKVHEMGFEIGNHTSNHPNLRDLTYEEQYAEIEETNRIIYEITGEKVRWFRPPYGKFNMDTITICNELRLQLMTWSFGYDWMDEYHDGTALAKVSLENDYLRPGANILMHDLSWTADALDKIIDGYRAKGYHIVDPYLIAKQLNSTAPLQP